MNKGFEPFLILTFCYRPGFLPGTGPGRNRTRTGSGPRIRTCCLNCIYILLLLLKLITKIIHFCSPVFGTVPFPVQSEDSEDERIKFVYYYCYVLLVYAECFHYGCKDYLKKKRMFLSLP